MNVKNESSENTLTNPASELFAPTTIRSVFWRPRFHVNSPILPYAPFLFWLADISRPQRIGVFGADDGFAHFLFCQTIDKLDSSGKVYGFGFWNDKNSDSQSPSIPEKISEHSDAFYEEISDLNIYGAPFSEAKKIAENSLNLLFADLNAFNEDTQFNVKDWYDLLNKNGLLIMHGTNDLGSYPRLATALNKHLDQRKRIVFFDGDGLIVYAMGESPPARLESLISACENGEIPSEIAIVFRRLGQKLKADAEIKELRIQNKNLETALDSTQNVLKKIEKELANFKETYEIKSQKLAETQSRLFDLKRKTKLSAEITQEDLQRRFEEISTLTRLLENQRLEKFEYDTELRKLHTEAALSAAQILEKDKNLQSLTHDLKEVKNNEMLLKQENQRLLAHNTGLLNSTSWRITAPIRKLKRVIK